MTTKDYVYLGLLALAALVFYCHGFYAGVSRSRRIYDTLLADESDPAEAVIHDTTAGEQETTPTLPRQPMLPPSRRELRNDFGNN